MKDGNARLWRFIKVYKVLIIALSAGCLGGAALMIIIMLIMA